MSNFISEQKKTIFIHLPKTGGRTITKILHKQPDFQELSDNIDKIPILYDSLKHCNNNFTDKKFKNYFVFAIVRNPYDRFISTYNWWFNTKNEIKVKSISFETALKDIELCYKKYRGFYCHAHIPLSDLLKYPQYVDKLIQFENYNEEVVKTLCKLEIINFTLGKTHISNKEKIDYLTKEFEEILYYKFKKDFSNFGYERKRF